MFLFLGLGIIVAPLIIGGTVGIKSLIDKFGVLSTTLVIMSFPFYIISVMDFITAIEKCVNNADFDVLKHTSQFAITSFILFLLLLFLHICTGIIHIKRTTKKK